MTSRQTPASPSERLLRDTRRRLAVFTLVLVGALVAVVGFSTVFVASRLMRDNIDRTLRAATADRGLLHELSDDGNEFRSAALGSADTFILLVDETGALLRDPAGVRLEGLPDAAAVEAAKRGEDIRDGTYGGVDVRLLTALAGNLGEDVVPGDRPVFLQVGFVLTLQEAQQRELSVAVVGVALFGLLGAALVTALVTRRALVPIRSAFATERRFVAAASHELRTPVTVIRSSAEILEREQLVSEDGRSFVADVIGEAERLGRLVHDLTALASAETGAIVVERRPLDLRSWFSDTARRAAALVVEGEVSLDVRSPPGSDPIIALVDAERLEQLVQILVDNALQHSPPHGIVTLGLDESRKRRVARLWVSDEGEGIPEADRERVFEPFARLDSRRRSDAGSGLGLAIARQLASDHAAELRVAAGPTGRGATLELLLPLAPAGTTSSAMPTSDPD